MQPDNYEKILQKYKDKIKEKGMSVTSFVTTSANGNILNKLSGASGNEEVNIEIKRGERWQIRGGTGTGKSALLGAIMGDVKVERGTLLISDKINIGHFSERHEDFKPDNSLIDEIHEVNGSLSHDRIRSILGHFLFTGDDQLKRVRVLSQGERSRLALAKLVIGNHNFLVIDEPTSHLDMKARGRLAEALKNYNGTLMLVSKDEDFVSDVGITHRLNLPKCEVSLFQG